MTVPLAFNFRLTPPVAEGSEGAKANPPNPDPSPCPCPMAEPVGGIEGTAPKLKGADWEADPKVMPPCAGCGAGTGPRPPEKELACSAPPNVLKEDMLGACREKEGVLFEPPNENAPIARGVAAAAVVVAGAVEPPNENAPIARGVAAAAAVAVAGAVEPPNENGPIARGVAAAAVAGAVEPPNENAPIARGVAAVAVAGAVGPPNENGPTARGVAAAAVAGAVGPPNENAPIARGVAAVAVAGAVGPPNENAPIARGAAAAVAVAGAVELPKENIPTAAGGASFGLEAMPSLWSYAVPVFLSVVIGDGGGLPAVFALVIEDEEAPGATVGI